MTPRARDQHPDEISLSEFLSSLAVIFSWVKDHIIGLILSITLFVGISLGWTLTRPSTYTAQLTFMLNDDNNPQITSIGGVLGQFGLPIPSGKYNVDKLLEIAKSRKILESAIFQTANIDGINTFLANHFINIYALRKVWSNKDTEYANFSFKTDSVENFSPEENFALKSLYNLIIGQEERSNALFQTDYGKTDYIMSFETTTQSPELSIAFTNSMYDEVSEFYIEKAVEKNQSVYDLIKVRRDSLAILVQETSYKIAQIKDRTAGSFRSINNVDVANLTAYLVGLETAYQEVEKSLNNADIVLKTGTPLIQLLDRPIPPLSPDGSGILKKIALATVLAIIFYLVFQSILQILWLSKNSNS